ncbi:MAG TPA: hypothetical protein VNF47_18390 [Streptosporangiaceae bacterium]|nr:hypothetical protein [Streptosporangiaceae bacterium]
MKKPRRAWIAASAAGLLLSFGLGVACGVAVAPSAAPAQGRVLCSANPCRISMSNNGIDGLVIQDARGPKVENALLIIDPIGIPEFWQNASGAYEGPRGEICTTDKALAPVACLGSDGKTGWVRIGGQKLTQADIAWLHRAEHAAPRRAATADKRRWFPARQSSVSIDPSSR